MLIVFFADMPKGLRKILDDGRYSFDDLWNLPHTREHEVVGKKKEGRVMIYNILLKEIGGEKGNNRIYAGKTIDAGARWYGHSEGLMIDSDTAGQMYVYGRLAKEWRMIVWSDLSKVPLERVHNTLRVAEFTAVALNFSWCDAVMEAGDSWLFDRLAAQIMSKVAEKAFAVTGWEPPKGCRGANWQTPLMDTELCHTSWTCQVVPLDNGHSVRVYRRAGLLSPAQGQKRTSKTKLLCLLAGGGDRRGQVMIMDEKLPDVGTRIFPVVEIYEGENQRHPIPFARVPEPGPTSDWTDLNRIGEWHQKYFWVNDLKKTNILYRAALRMAGQGWAME